MIKKTNVPLKYLTSFQLEGTVQSCCVFQAVSELAAFRKSKQPALFLGLGSNSLIDPKTTKTIVQVHAGMFPPELQAETLVVGAGVTVNQLLKFCVAKGLSGLEFVAGVPASVGGMAAMNFGCWGHDMSQWITAVEVMGPEGDVEWLSSDQLMFGYRSSVIQSSDWVVLRVAFRCQLDASERIQQRIRANIQTRVEKQPLRAKTFGSIFKNPDTVSAGALLEQLGYRGKQFGAVTFSQEHANFLVNSHHATFEEVLDVLHTVQADVQRQTGILLALEVKVLS